MNTEQMINFAREQLEIFTKNSQMGVFLQCVIDKLETKNAEMKHFKVGDIVRDICDDTRAVILDDGDYEYQWKVMTELGCVEEWHEKDIVVTGATNNVKYMIEELR